MVPLDLAGSLVLRVTPTRPNMNFARLQYLIKRATTIVITWMLVARTVCRTLIVIVLNRGQTRVMLRSWYGRLGNNLIQLANARHFSQRLGLVQCWAPHHDFLQIDKLFEIHTTLPHKFMQAKHRLIAEGALLELGGWAYELVNNFGNPDEYQLSQSVCRDFYFKLAVFPMTLNVSEYRTILRDEIRLIIPFQKDVRISEDTLVIHMRGGDVFSEQSHPAYTQPPLSFYQCVIEQHSTDEIVIVTQDKYSNPCLALLLERYPYIRVQSESLSEDINTLLTARHLVVSTGTFSIALAFCSQAIQTLYLPILDINRRSGSVKLLPSIWSPVNILAAKADLDFEVCAWQIQDYLAIGNWFNKEEQRALMVAHTADKIVGLS